MEKLVKLIYHYHSGFSVQVGGTLLIFDYWEGEDRKLPNVGRITPQFLRAFEQIYVFVSHAHQDHLDPIVYLWKNEGLPITYIVSSDMPIGTTGKRIAPGQEKKLSDNVSVKAFDSTDIGVSFLVTAYGVSIFHAGDLNLWHWRDESSITEIEAAEKAFYACVEPIPKETIDLAFFPVDPRQGSMYDAGAGYFVMTVKPRILIPMHFQGRGDVAMRFALTGETNHTKIVALEAPGDSIDLSIPDTDETAPDRKLKALLADEEFGRTAE